MHGELNERGEFGAQDAVSIKSPLWKETCKGFQVLAYEGEDESDRFVHGGVGCSSGFAFTPRQEEVLNATVLRRSGTEHVCKMHDLVAAL
ncbi:hypothetical protein EW026_g2049 [Hermanssonia centrifuga]|uniref:Uncharacterized protein n=1 Tax=Hermanssonia centrifuga TaxID=98765 RepID=A0A4S4KPG2_9APHY|nr:hypothetical protein EW026_g2049 [Hermanssonia centrifuga]